MPRWTSLLLGPVLLAGCGGDDGGVLLRGAGGDAARDAPVLQERLRALHEGATVAVEDGALRASVRPEAPLLLRGDVQVLDWDRARVSRRCAARADAAAAARRVRGGFVVRATAPASCFLAVRPRVLARDVVATGVAQDRTVLRFAAADAARWKRIEHVAVVVDDVLLGVVHGDPDGRLAVPADDPDALAAALATPPLSTAYRWPRSS